MKGRVLKLVLLVFVLTACGTLLPSTSALEVEPTTFSPTQVSASETPAVESVLKFHPLATRTNIQQIDDILKAISDDTPQVLINLFGYSKIPCMTVNALGGPPACRAGEPEGTIVEVLPFLDSEGSFLHKENAESFPGLDVVGLYAIFEVSDTAYSDVNYPAGDYGIALVARESLPGVILHVKNGKIIRIDYVYNTSSLPEILQRDASTFILNPIAS